MSFYRKILAVFFKSLCHLGRPFGGIKPYRMYHWLSTRAYPTPEFSWYKNLWGEKLKLSPHIFLDTQIIALGQYEKDVHLLLEQYLEPGMTCLDIGANIGELSIHMARKVAPSGAVHAFEPVPRLYERLSEHVEVNAVTNLSLHQLAISNETGSALINFADPLYVNQGAASIVNFSKSHLSNQSEVATMTLDDFVSSNGLNKVHLIKADIQGAEPLMLEGGKRVFTELSPILITEVEAEDLNSFGWSSPSLLALIESYGYTVYKIDHGPKLVRIEAKYCTEDLTCNVFCRKE